MASKQHFEKHLCPYNQGNDDTDRDSSRYVLVYSPFSQLKRLLARENIIQFSLLKIFELSKEI